MIEIVAFDVFGTLVNMQDVPRDELRAYLEHIRHPEYAPLNLPDSWLELDLFDDVVEGLRRLNEQVPYVVTLSNCPIEMQIAMLSGPHGRSALEHFSTLVPLQLLKVFKPNHVAYRTLFTLFPDHPAECFAMVTANEHFGDLEAARSLGMKAVLIRGDTGIDVSDLAGMAERGEI